MLSEHELVYSEWLVVNQLAEAGYKCMTVRLLIIELNYIL